MSVCGREEVEGGGGAPEVASGGGVAYRGIP